MCCCRRKEQSFDVQSPEDGQWLVTVTHAYVLRGLTGSASSFRLSADAVAVSLAT